jgi:hypothetical protein
MARKFSAASTPDKCLMIGVAIPRTAVISDQHEQRKSEHAFAHSLKPPDLP